MDTLEQLRDDVLATADAWNEAGEDYDKFYELLDSSLDLEFSINQRGEFSGYELAVTLGGPSVYIKQKSGWDAHVNGYSWGETFSDTLNSDVSAMLWDTISELWEGTKEGMLN